MEVHKDSIVCKGSLGGFLSDNRGLLSTLTKVLFQRESGEEVC